MMKQSYSQASRLAMIAGCALGMAGAVAAQDAAPPDDAAAEASRSGDIVVTATRRSELVRNIPASISALSETQLEEAGALQAKDVARLVPGLAYTEVNSGQAVLAVRGVQTSAVFGNLQQPVALYYDDVPVLDLVIPWTVPRLQLFDVDRVEVLRGPQGTLFGAGALSGAIRVINSKPNLSAIEAGVDGTLTMTEGGGIGSSVNAKINAPLVTDRLAVRVVGHVDHSPGWVDNSVLMDREANRGKSYGGRIALTWKPADNFELIATAAQEINKPNDSAYVVYGSASDTSDFRIRTFNTDNSKILNLNATYSMPWASLTSSTSYLSRRASSSMDFSGFANSLTGLTADSPLDDDFRTNNFVQEVRLASNGDGPFKWVVGGFFENYNFDLHETISQVGVTDIPLDFVSGPTYPTDFLEDTRIKTRIRDYAVFGELSYELAPGLTITAGARYSDYSIKSRQDGAISGTTIFEGPPSTQSNASSNSAVTPKFSISYKPNNDVMVYALVSKGFRTGNANLATIDPFSGQPLPDSYDPDALWNYEIGTKLSLFDRRLTIDAAAFYIDWKKIQLQVRTPNGIPYTDNAGSAKSKGVEATIVARPAIGAEFGTSLSYTDAKLTSVEPGVPAAQVGDRLPGSSPFTAYVYGQYGFPVGEGGRIALRMDYSYSGRAFSDLGNKNNPAALSFGKYSEVGARVLVSTGLFDLSLFVQNLTNNRGRISARQYFLVPVEVRQMPRTFGVRISADW
jgi:outer membrane receptor protein involved in Fe transport